MKFKNQSAYQLFKELLSMNSLFFTFFKPFSTIVFLFFSFIVIKAASSDNHYTPDNQKQSAVVIVHPHSFTGSIKTIVTIDGKEKK